MTKTKPSDPAYWLLQPYPGKPKIEIPEVYNSNCYICTDNEFAIMGLPLCYPCYKCGAHVPADDSVCDNGHEQESLDNPVYAEFIKGQDNA